LSLGRRIVRVCVTLLAVAAASAVFTAAGPAAPTTWNYVAMGDSYSSGVGTGS
jgi:hypothetical protein